MFQVQRVIFSCPHRGGKLINFEIRKEDPDQNRRFFYQLDGEGIRHELVSFAKAVELGACHPPIERDTSLAIARIVEKFARGDDCLYLKPLDYE